MIRKVEVIFKESAIWSRGNITKPLIPPFRDGQVILSKEYPRGTPVEEIWSDIRDEMMGYFFAVFYPQVIAQTSPPKIPVEDPDVALHHQSEHIRKRVSKLPEFYVWNERLKKWHISPEGYARLTVEKGGDIKMGIAISPFEEVFESPSLIEDFEELHPGETVSFFLFLYPDRYKAEIRAIFEIRITFY